MFRYDTTTSCLRDSGFVGTNVACHVLMIHHTGCLHVPNRRPKPPPAYCNVCTFFLRGSAAADPKHGPDETSRAHTCRPLHC